MVRLSPAGYGEAGQAHAVRALLPKQLMSAAVSGLVAGACFSVASRPSAELGVARVSTGRARGAACLRCYTT